MTSVRFVRFYPSDWRSGCIGMSLEQEGLYIRICAFIYETNRRLPNSTSQAAKLLGVNTNAYIKVHAQLVELGKLIACDGEWTVARVEKELAAAQGAIGAADQERGTERPGDKAAEREAGAGTLGDTPQDTPHDARVVTPLDAGGVCSKSANEISAPFIEPITNNQNQKKKPRKPLAGASPSECLTAFENWNDLALRCGLPQAAKLTPDRQRKIAARLKVYGLDGWQRALAHIEQSAFLTGQNDRGWRVNLEFVLQPASFAKLHDGAYGNGRHADGKPPPGKSDFSKFAHLYEGPAT